MWADSEGKMRDFRHSSRSVLLGPLCESEKRVRQRVRFEEEPFELEVGFSSLTEIHDFFEENDFGCTDRVARLIMQHPDVFIRGKRVLKFFRRPLSHFVHFSGEERYAEIAEIFFLPPYPGSRVVSVDATISLLNQLTNTEPGDHVGVLTEPLLTAGQTDIFQLTGNGPSIKSVSADTMVREDTEFFFLA